VIVVPAIDLMGGRVVRLTRGEARTATVYHDDPVEWASELARQGAQRLHVVDLDGAFEGRPVHTAVIARIARETGVPVQAGGGLRTLEAVEALVEAGVTMTVLGTAAIGDPGFLDTALARFGDRIAVGLDARGGLVAVKGWTETSSLRAMEIAAAMGEKGVARLIYTDVARDGELAGPDLEGTREVAEAFGGPVTASGGIASIADIEALRTLDAAGVDACIIGKALYERRISLATAMEAAR
jgi:phosphoribosylformimino-5-aminoimidazole carboxamide ribotide isomerase